MSTTPPIVYLGPSLPLAEAEQLLAAEYRPPIKRGDLPHAHHGTIVIIDGEFGQNLSVSPHEILRLLDGGTAVLGASSMGALRAAELAACGMQGHGWIFEQYRSGRIIADDEVAIAYSPFDLRPVTVPLVNVRFWLERLEHAGELTPSLARRMLAAARRVFYADRSEQRLRGEWKKLIGTAELRRLDSIGGAGITDIKAADARQLLMYLAAQQNDARAPTAAYE